MRMIGRIFSFYLILSLTSGIITLNSNSEDSKGYLDHLPDHMHATVYKPVTIDLFNKNNEREKQREYHIFWGDGHCTTNGSNKWSQDQVYSHSYKKTGLYTMNIMTRNESGLIESKNITVQCHIGNSPPPPITVYDYIYPMDIFFWTFVASMVFLLIIVIGNVVLMIRYRRMN
jgi:hypothetical protein